MSAGSSGGGPNSEIDATLENASHPTSLEILDAIDDPQGEFTAPLGPAAAVEAAGRDPIGDPPEPAATSLSTSELSISTQEARDSKIMLAPRPTPETDQSNVDSEELDYGDSDDEDVEAVDFEDLEAVDEDAEAVVEDVEAVVEDVEAVVEEVEAVVEDAGHTVDEDVDAVVEDVEAVVEDIGHTVNEDVEAVVEDVEAVVEELVSSDQEANTNMLQQIEAPTDAEISTTAVCAQLEPVPQSSNALAREPLQVQHEHDELLILEEQLRSAEVEADPVEAVVTNQAFSGITPNQVEDATEKVIDHKDVDNMLEHMVGAPPGDAHTMNTALKLSQAGDTSKVVSILEPILYQQEDQDDGTASDQKDDVVEKDASDSSTESSSSSNTRT